MQKEINKTTENDFKLLEKEGKKWIAFFGLKGWEINFLHKNDDLDSLGYTKFNYTNRIADVVLCKDWGKRKVTEKEIKKTAFHEICEVLMYRLRYIAESRFITDVETNEEIHNIIRILENTIFFENK